MKILFYFAFLLQLKYSMQEEFVYSSLPQSQFDLTFASGISYGFIQTKDAELIFVAAGSRGIVVLNSSNFKVIHEQRMNYQIQSIGATSDGKYIFFQQSYSFSVYSFEDRKDIKQISSLPFQFSISQIKVSEDNKQVFVCGQNGILAVFSFQLNTLGSEIFTEIGRLVTGSYKVSKITISSNNKWIFIGNIEKGFTLVKYSPSSSSSIQTTPLFQIAGYGRTYWKTFECIPKSSFDYVYCSDSWDGIYIFSLIEIMKADESLYPMTLNFLTKQWPCSQYNPTVFYLCFLKGENFLVVSSRSLGIFIFDIFNPLELVLYQRVSVEGYPVQLSLSQEGDRLLYSSKIKMYAFQRVPLNFNTEPNLFNSHQSKLFDLKPDIFFKWKCYLTKDNSYLLSTMDYEGIQIIKLVGGDAFDLEIVSSVDENTNNYIQHASFKEYQGFSYMFLITFEKNCEFKTYDITNPQQPLLVNCLNIDTQYFLSQGSMISKDEQLLGYTFDIGFVLVDVSNPLNCTLLSIWVNEDEGGWGEVSQIMINDDNKWVICSIRGYGIIIFDISDKKNPELKDSMHTHGGESLKISQKKANTAYLIDGFLGIAILDLSALPQITVMSRVSLKGWSNDLQIIENDKYLLVSTMDENLLTLIEIENPSFPKVISILKEGTQSSESVCLTSDNQFAFVNNQYGIRVVPLQTSIKIHTEFIRSGNLLKANEILKIGDVVQLNFVPLYMSEGMVVKEILYFPSSTKIMQGLPSWICSINSNWSVIINIVKEVILSYQGDPIENTIVLKVMTSLTEKNFLFNNRNLITSKDEAQQIFQELQSMQFIDNKGYATSAFSYTTTMNLNTKISSLYSKIHLAEKVKRTLLSSTLFLPVTFTSDISLQFKMPSANKAQNSPAITSPQGIIFIALLLQNSSCIFVDIPYTGLSLQLQSSSTLYQIFGPQNLINEMFFKGVFISCKGKEPSGEIFLQIADDLNPDYINTFPILKATFLITLEPITVNKEKFGSLQTQFNQYYSSSEIQIEVELSFSFNNDYFSHPLQLNLPITFTLQYFDSSTKKFVDAIPSYWIKLEKLQLKFQGFASYEILNSIQTIKVIASNSYVSVEEELSISVSLLPFIFVLNILTRVFGIVIGVFGFYKFKNKFCSPLQKYLL